MSNKFVSLAHQNDSQTIEMTVASSYLSDDVRLEKNEDSSQPFSHNLHNSIVSDVNGFPTTSSVGLGGAEVVESSNMIFNQNAGVMYINAEGNVVFKTKEIPPPSAGTLPIPASSRPGSALCLEDSSNMNQNYLVVVENPDGSQTLSSDFSSSLVMNAESCEPNAVPSLSTARANVDGLKSDNTIDHPHQHTIMVLDSQLGSESILIDPDVLVAYENPSGEQMSFSMDPDLETNARPIPDQCQGSYIQLEDAHFAGENNYSSQRSVLPKSSLTEGGQPIQTVVITPHINDQNEKAKGFDIAKESIKIKEAQAQPSDDQSENSKLLQQKEELRMLERYHLQHHMEEVKKKLNSQCETIAGARGKELMGVTISSQEADDPNLTNAVDDKASVFSNITAKISANFLAHVPGCQRFLFEKIKQSPPSSQLHITFDSEADCTFSGSLTSLIEIHNGLKKLTDIKDVSLLDWKVAKKRETTCDQGVMCSLLQPFISSRGRQPKYSYKAKAMDFTSDFESLLNIDNAEDFDERLPQTSPKKKRGRRGKPKKNIGRKKNHTSEDAPVDQIPVYISNQNSKEEDTSAPHYLAKSPPAVEDATDISPDLGDPLQQKLLEEQIKYRKRLQSNTNRSDLHPGSDSDDALPSHSTLDCNKEGQEILETESPVVSHTTITTRTRRCRPPKFLKQYEKVQPRNPLTESESTKQIRVYEENLAFKFFCKHCSFKSKRHSHFLIHMRCHKDGTEKTYSCKSCDFVTLSLSYLKRHELKHKENLFSCKICAAYQSDKEALLHRHIRMKHGSNLKVGVDDNLQCSQCSFQASSDKDLVQHKLAHSRLDGARNKTVYSCPECKRTLRSKMHLHRHIRDVHGPDIRPHLCDKCGKAFKRTDALRQHKVLHESKANRSLPHKCSTCGKGFRSLAHLKEHLVIHTSERPYLCQYCGAAFKTQAVQKRHILTLHIKPRAHVCSVCSRQFNTKHALQRHESTHVKNDTAQESAVTVVDGLEARHNTFDEKEKSIAISNIEAQVADISVALKVEEDDNENIATGAQVSSVLVQDVIGAASAHSGIEDQMGPENQRIQHTYIQGNQDATTLYYFAGDLHSL